MPRLTEQQIRKEAEETKERMIFALFDGGGGDEGDELMIQTLEATLTRLQDQVEGKRAIP